MEYCGQQGIALRKHQDDDFLLMHDLEDKNDKTLESLLG